MFTDAHEAEGVKGTVHLTMLLLLAGMTVYNTVAYMRRRERHLAVNAAIYAGGVVYETVKTVRHFRDAESGERAR